MKKEQVAETIRQVIHNPQTARPPISYRITDVSQIIREDGGYSSEYIDVKDFELYLSRLEAQLVARLASE